MLSLFVSAYFLIFLFFSLFLVLAEFIRFVLTLIFFAVSEDHISGSISEFS